MKAELEEANSDLQRDERIFNEKMLLIEQLEKDNVQLREAASAAASAALAAAAPPPPEQQQRNVFQSPAPASRGGGTSSSFSSMAQTPQSARKS